MQKIDLNRIYEGFWEDDQQRGKFRELTFEGNFLDFWKLGIFSSGYISQSGKFEYGKLIYPEGYVYEGEIILG